MAAGRKKQRVAILGGGTASLATAFYLTNQADWRDRFETITVYQMGWRLGGKGASGRGGESRRIEEHGLHVWMGWYANAFRMIRQVYQELGRPPEAPLATWDQAFKKHSLIVLGEEVDGQWKAWPLDFPTNDQTPGEGGEYPTLWSYIAETLRGLRQLLKGARLVEHRRGPVAKLLYPGKVLLAWLERGLRWLGVEVDLVTFTIGEELLKAAQRIASEVAGEGDRQQPHHREALFLALRQFAAWLQERVAHGLHADDEARRLYYMLDVGMTCVLGVLAEDIDIDAHALDALDAYDFRDWLRQHGAAEATLNSSLIAGFYDLLFAYRDGDPQQQRVATGVALRFIFRMCLTYKGAIFWKMQAGMGDTIFAPLYTVLQQRGVEFAFFHRVKNLRLSADGTSVSTIQIGRQATLKNGAYHPFLDCQSLPCWPSEPLYDQLVEGKELQEQAINLESFWTPWADVAEVTLAQGSDFDIVVFGISLGSTPYLCQELVAASAAWQQMVQHVETVRTQAVQLWLKPSLQALGWQLGSAVADVYPDPFNTWADMSHLIQREGWAQDRAPGTITYLCAPMPGGIPSPDDQAAPMEACAKVQEWASAWLDRYGARLWPNATEPGNPGRLNQALILSQFFRANLDPSERYVLSLPNTTQYRLRADDRHFDNLYVAGDWIYTGSNAGCIEATVISGMLAAHAICGVPTLQKIIGYADP